MKQVQEVSEESDAIEDDYFDAAGSLIYGSGKGSHFIINDVRRNKNVVINPVATLCNFLKRAVNVSDSHPLILHLVTGRDFVITDERDLHVAQCARLPISGIM